MQDGKQRAISVAATLIPSGPPRCCWRQPAGCALPERGPPVPRGRPHQRGDRAGCVDERFFPFFATGALPLSGIVDGPERPATRFRPLLAPPTAAAAASRRVGGGENGAFGAGSAVAAGTESGREAPRSISWTGISARARSPPSSPSGLGLRYATARRRLHRKRRPTPRFWPKRRDRRPVRDRWRTMLRFSKPSRVCRRPDAGPPSTRPTGHRDA